MFHTPDSTNGVGLNNTTESVETLHDRMALSKSAARDSGMSDTNREADASDSALRDHVLASKKSSGTDVDTGHNSSLKANFSENVSPHSGKQEHEFGPSDSNCAQPSTSTQPSGTTKDEKARSSVQDDFYGANDRDEVIREPTLVLFETVINGRADLDKSADQRPSRCADGRTTPDDQNSHKNNNEGGSSGSLATDTENMMTSDQESNTEPRATLSAEVEALAKEAENDRFRQVLLDTQEKLNQEERRYHENCRDQTRESKILFVLNRELETLKADNKRVVKQVENLREEKQEALDKIKEQMAKDELAIEAKIKLRFPDLWKIYHSATMDEEINEILRSVADRRTILDRLELMARMRYLDMHMRKPPARNSSPTKRKNAVPGRRREESTAGSITSTGTGTGSEGTGSGSRRRVTGKRTGTGRGTPAGTPSRGAPLPANRTGNGGTPHRILPSTPNRETGEPRRLENPIVTNFRRIEAAEWWSPDRDAEEALPLSVDVTVTNGPGMMRGRGRARGTASSRSNLPGPIQARVINDDGLAGRGRIAPPLNNISPNVTPGIFSPTGGDDTFGEADSPGGRAGGRNAEERINRILELLRRDSRWNVDN